MSGAATESSSEGFRTAHDLCEAAVDYVLENVNTVQYLLQSIEGITGAPFPRDRIKCLPAVPLEMQRYRRGGGGLALTAPGTAKATKADASAPTTAALIMRPDQVFAGYMWRRARPDCDKGDIVLVEDHLAWKNGPSTGGDGDDAKKATAAAQSASPQQVGATISRRDLLERDHKKALTQTERNIRHELIHAFDDSRGFVESADCTHQACSEIRAARLSGDCFAGEEAKKGRFTFFEGGVQCVRRRATMAVEMNPVCRGFSDRAVETVFQRCYSDYEPFAAPVYALGSYGTEMFENGTLKL